MALAMEVLRAGGFAARVLCSFGAVACAWLSTGAAAQVAVMTRTAEDREVAAQLGQLVEVPVREHEDTEARPLAQVLQDARAWPEPHVVVIDRPFDTVHVLRPRDTTAVSRVLSAGVMLDSQYAVALATAELLEWLGVLPAARGRPSEPSPAVPASPVAGPRHEGEPPEEARSMLGWAAGVDLELATSPGFDVSLARPSISAELQIGRGRQPLWFGFGARLGAPASWDRGLPPERFTTAAE